MLLVLLRNLPVRISPSLYRWYRRVHWSGVNHSWPLQCVFYCGSWYCTHHSRQRCCCSDRFVSLDCFVWLGRIRWWCCCRYLSLCWLAEGFDSRRHSCSSHWNRIKKSTTMRCSVIAGSLVWQCLDFPGQSLEKRKGNCISGCYIVWESE